MKYLERGNTPANNIAHWSLGLMNDAVIKRAQKAMGNVAIHELDEVDLFTKYVYGMNFRRDIYVLDRAGYEIRNCLRRVECLKAKLLELAENIEDGFSKYRDLLPDYSVVTTRLFRSLSFQERRLLNQLDRYLRKKHRGHAIGGADFKTRFTFPTIDWANHPLIRQLSTEQQIEFWKKLARSTQKYRDTLKTIAQSKLRIDEKLKQVQIAIARWGFDSELHMYLKTGKQKFLEDKSTN